MQTNINNAKVLISNDYSYITYEGTKYVPISFELLPKNIIFNYKNQPIKANVEGENYFLDKFFFTNYVYFADYNEFTFIYLNTDYDVNESDYYCSIEYKDNLK
jgi:hypothetical protein